MRTIRQKKSQKMYKLAKMEILVRRAGRKKEKCTRMCYTEAHGGSEGSNKEARLVRRED